MTNPKGKLVALFDLDGTLVNTDKINTEAYRRALAKSGVTNVGEMTGRITMQTVLEKIGGGDVGSISRIKADEYAKLLWESELGPAAEALRMVLASRDMFGKVVLLTDGKERRALETLRFYGLDRCFDEIVCNAGMGDKYLNYFRMYDANPAVTIVWENDSRKVSTAASAGVDINNIKKVGE